MRRLAIALALGLAAAGPGACGSAAGRPDLLVAGATSLRSAFAHYGATFSSARVRNSFGGSDLLAAQIRQGARPDVFASASTTLPAALHTAGLVDAPVVFAANRLVIALPAGASRIGSLRDLARRGVTIAAGSPAVPVGSYTRRVLARLPATERSAIEANIRSSEPDVGGVVGKLTQGAVDAGFVYATDVRAASGRLRTIELPRRLEPRVAYAAAIVRGAPHPREARAFIAGLLHGGGRQALLEAGFEPPPSR
ncbi:MAG: molybdate transport system substrate-binding protein [Solirubrobacteraceae bacterium]|nr:molybdate transport system substrate-binding protein [Solirubrobacteraceae bacterium]